jgi:hypothetical protein
MRKAPSITRRHSAFISDVGESALASKGKRAEELRKVQYRAACRAIKGPSLLLIPRDLPRGTFIFQQTLICHYHLHPPEDRKAEIKVPRRKQQGITAKTLL